MHNYAVRTTVPNLAAATAVAAAKFGAVVRTA